MNISNNLPSNFANAIAPFSPLGSSSVGEESVEAKNTPFKPVERLADSAKAQSQQGRGDELLQVQRAQVSGVALSSSDIEDDSAALDDTQTADSNRAGTSAQSDAQFEQEQALLQELAARDREVRAHEQAHAAVGGVYAGAPVFQFERGPDGVAYAVGGEVSISTSKVSGDPQATIEKARQIRNAALAPADPSPQDRQVAAYAAQLELEARQELRELQAAEAEQKAEALTGEDDEQRAQANGSTVAADTETSLSTDTNSTEENPSDSPPRLSSFDLNRHLIDIGVNISSLPPSGSLLDQQA